MGVLAVTARVSWQPVTIDDTSTISYWLNWRVILCALWVLITMIFASILISMYEGTRRLTLSSDNGSVSSRVRVIREEEIDGIIYADQVWKPCLKGIHPGWLLTFRVFGFLVLLILLIVNASVDGGSIFYYYTQWTFTLVTLYFGLGSVLSMYGCYDYQNKISGERIENESIDSERGGASDVSKTNFSSCQPYYPRPIAGFWGYVLQVIYQMNAGAVVLTDCVFWFILVPFLATKNYKINFFMINMHTINLAFLLGEAALNCLRFPWFRIAYFILWTSFYVIFQWVLHACISIWWPYPFLDLSWTFAPLWYASVAIMHIPCYGIFFLIIKLKHMLLSKYFPHSYLCYKG